MSTSVLLLAVGIAGVVGVVSVISAVADVAVVVAVAVHRLELHLHLSADDVIRLHTAKEFAVYAVGFVPGFPYLGYLPPELSGVGRLPSPRVRVEPRSVAITGRQTAIYPQASPGGWNLIGRTPLVIVDVQDGFFPLRVGDRVRFARIDETRYRELEGERLDPPPTSGCVATSQTR